MVSVDASVVMLVMCAGGRHTKRRTATGSTCVGVVWWREVVEVAPKRRTRTRTREQMRVGSVVWCRSAIDSQRVVVYERVSVECLVEEQERERVVSR